jgi:hypothetical protein
MRGDSPATARSGKIENREIPAAAPAAIPAFMNLRRECFILERDLTSQASSSTRFVLAQQKQYTMQIKSSPDNFPRINREVTGPYP